MAKTKKEPAINAGIPEPELVEEFMANLDYPLADAIQYLRKIILGIDENIGEGIFYKAPVFYYTGEMKPFDSKEYRRYIVGTNLFQKDSLRLIFLRGAYVSDPSGVLEGKYTDGRRLMSISSLDDLKSKEKALIGIVRELLGNIND